MKKNLLLYIGFGLVSLVWVLNLLAITFSFYWTLGWYDYMMHFLGGLAIGILVIWLLSLRASLPKSFLIVFIGVMAVGVGWEIFEYLNGLTFSTEGYALDTFHDLLMDAVGAVAAYYWTITSLKRESL